MTSDTQTPFRWNASTGQWEFHEPAWGGWCVLRINPHESSRPMTLIEGIRHLIAHGGDVAVVDAEAEAL